MRIRHGSGAAAVGRWPLFALAAAALGLIAARALLQSITIDEGDTYVYWVSGGLRRLSYPHSNNHLLNTYLIWVFTRLFGLNNVSMRLPAFLGAVLYLGATYRFCVARVAGDWLRVALYACLIGSPIVLDFFVAARGYGLALGLLTVAVVIQCGLLEEDPSDQVGRLAAASACLGLSFVANFSFALVDAVAMGLFLPAWLGPGRSGAGPRRRARLCGLMVPAAIIPGALIATILAGWTLAHWPRGQLVYGALSWRETWESLAAYVFPGPEQWIFPKALARALAAGAPVVLALAALVALGGWAFGSGRRPASRASRRGGGDRAVVYLWGVIAAAVAAHEAAFHWAGLLLPKDRTAVYFVPLCLMAVGAAAGTPAPSAITTGLRRATAALLTVIAVCFLGCLRLRYFMLWRFDADIRECYVRLVEVVGRGRRIRIPSEFDATSALNYYREFFGDDSFEPFALYDNPRFARETRYLPYPPGSPAYVLYLSRDSDFIAERHLRIVYRGPTSDLVIAVGDGLGR